MCGKTRITALASILISLISTINIVNNKPLQRMPDRVVPGMYCACKADFLCVSTKKDIRQLVICICYCIVSL